MEEEELKKETENKSDNPINENLREKEVEKVLNLKSRDDLTEEYSHEIAYNRGHLNGFKAGQLAERERCLKIIKNIETQYPDDDGVPFNRDINVFVEELTKKVSEVKK